MKRITDGSSNQLLALRLIPRPKSQNTTARSRLWLICSGLVAACLASATTARAEVITVSADQDASAAWYANFNDSENQVGYRTFGSVEEFRAAIRFPLPAALESAWIQSATLKLYYFDAWGSFDSRSVRAHRILQSWSEADVFFDAPRDSSFTETTVGGTNFRWISWDVTAAARLWVANSATNFGIMLVADPAGSSDNAFRFYSREFADPAYRPVLEVTYLIPPQITTQPQSVVAVPGGTATLQVAANGTSPLGFQWRKGGIPLLGSTATSITFSPVQIADAGSYDVVVTNAWGSVTSSAAYVTVAFPPQITTQPQSVAVLQGGTATFQVAASGAPPLSYQWRKGGNALPGALSNAYSIFPVQNGDAGSYDVVITNAWGSVTSTPALLNDWPVISLFGQWPGYGRGPANDVAVSGSRAYVASTWGGLVIFDISNPTNAAPLGGYGNTSGSAEAVQVV
ncbi:MAG: DNRLRE domain-containing protein, partial [Verrucomicrobia bacterium]|nr:DNRLRE domain-containing protein [Verrucomicrobiota bacterium]